MQDKLIEAEIDDGILGVVLVLNDAGVKTFSSCQGGGYGWGHGYLRPIVCFDGDDSEGERAEKIATDAGYQVFQVQRVWYTRDGERVGPFWEMEFVAGAACRAPKDRAAVRVHDAGTDEELRKAIHILRTTPITPEHGFECGTELGVAFSTGFGHAIKILEKASASHAAESAPQDGISRLRELCAAVYQFVGANMHKIGGCRRFLDALSNAANGEPFDLEHLLPYDDKEPICFTDVQPSVSTAQLDAKDPAEPGEDAISRMCKLMGGCACEHCIKRMTASLAVAREGYVKLEDVERAIRTAWARDWCGIVTPESFEQFLALIMARLAPKPSRKPPEREAQTYTGIQSYPSPTTMPGEASFIPSTINKTPPKGISAQPDSVRPSTDDLVDLALKVFHGSAHGLLTAREAMEKVIAVIEGGSVGIANDKTS